MGVGSVALSAGTWLRAQQAANPVNVDAKALRNAGAHNDALPGSWLTYGRTQGETRYSKLKQINDTNAKRLGLAWSYAVGAGGGNQEGTPLMWNNTLYGITPWIVVYALDARTGKELWRWDPEVNQTTVRPKICCGIVNRGLAIYNGTIIAAINDGRLQALDARTGKPIEESRVSYPQDPYTVTMAPQSAGGQGYIWAPGGGPPPRVRPAVPVALGAGLGGPGDRRLPILGHADAELVGTSQRDLSLVPTLRSARLIEPGGEIPVLRHAVAILEIAAELHLRGGLAG